MNNEAVQPEKPATTTERLGPPYGGLLVAVIITCCMSASVNIAVIVAIGISIVPPIQDAVTESKTNSAIIRETRREMIDNRILVEKNQRSLEKNHATLEKQWKELEGQREIVSRANNLLKLWEDMMRAKSPKPKENKKEKPTD